MAEETIKSASQMTTFDNEAFQKMLEDSKPKVCPHCGRCPTCGRGANDWMTPYQPWAPVPQWPSWQGPYWMGNYQGSTTK